MRVSAPDWAEGSWNLEDTLHLAKGLIPLGVDLIDCSSGGNVPNPQIPLGPGYRVPFAAAVSQIGIPTGAVSLITEVQQAEKILQAG